MKAIEFIKKFGWADSSHKNVWFYFGCTSEKSFEAIYGFRVVEDLKRYVNAYELVHRFGGMDESKKCLDDKIYPELGRAITLVEEVENYNEKTKEGDPS
ncbi:MAG: hypothetical protein J5965_20510 [Aeriscardovia sp.]|nr:hypothetical protein [Aeriscardovia sp.]